MVSLEFFFDIILPAVLRPWFFDSTSKRNEYKGDKGSRCVGLTNLPPSCADCLEIWEAQTPRTPRIGPGL